MNEEIKKVINEQIDGLKPVTMQIEVSSEFRRPENIPVIAWSWIEILRGTLKLEMEKIAKEAYLQGAKDMWEVAKIKELNARDIFYGKSEIERGFEQAYNMAIRDMKAKAQQFIDSLEKGTNNE